MNNSDGRRKTEFDSPVGDGQGFVGISDTTADERPSFSPNSKLIVYATRQNGREALMTTTLDGKIKARLAGQGGAIRQPNWGPFQK